MEHFSQKGSTVLRCQVSAKSRKQYDREFKIGAVKLVTEEGKSVLEVSRGLGVSTHSIYAWLEQFKENPAEAFPGSGNLKASEEELRRLREENRILRMERDLLKKTLPLFMEARK